MPTYRVEFDRFGGAGSLDAEDVEAPDPAAAAVAASREADRLSGDGYTEVDICTVTRKGYPTHRFAVRGAVIAGQVEYLID